MYPAKIMTVLYILVPQHTHPVWNFDKKLYTEVYIGDDLFVYPFLWIIEARESFYIY